MARKIFVSYKHSDQSVAPLSNGITARSYVDKLIDLFDEDEIYKGEGNEDLSDFKDTTIASHLKDKIYDSSVTLVLISPNMKDWSVQESDQWIPWEISYSLKQITRNGRTSQTNAVLTIVLPDQFSRYDYFLEENACPYCHTTTLHTYKLFQILRDNMFNMNNPTYNGCLNHERQHPVHSGYPSYIHSVKWCDFINYKESYLKIAENKRDEIDDYKITKEIKE